VNEKGKQRWQNKKWKVWGEKGKKRPPRISRGGGNAHMGKRQRSLLQTIGGKTRALKKKSHQKRNREVGETIHTLKIRKAGEKINGCPSTQRDCGA